MRRLSYANVTATLALFIALGGSSYAAVKLSRNSVRSPHIKNGQVKRADLARDAVTAAKVRDGSLLAADFAAGQLAAGPTGPAGARGETGAVGPTGPAGANGEPATRLFAFIDGGDAGTLQGPTVEYGSGVTGVSRNGAEPGQYRVSFDRGLAGCVALATPMLRVAAFLASPARAAVTVDGSVVRLSMFDASDNPDDTGVALAVFC